MAHVHPRPFRNPTALPDGDAIPLASTRRQWQREGGSGSSMVNLVADETTIALQRPHS
ncbi:hypothetical protein PVA19_10280 [Agrobacterium sp. CNPSo 3708]|uniref:hypothetical protein n=1 Tax=Agrobacterium sp. CNPSo 3708 TaxID=3028150 RepID=UPI0023644F53|nr:hypothetical protein [Agrobacterium sp. CNPSo 3708]MDD1498796.1 hypothetical protein [Agrobacterium sp. CNPSo 3708]